MKRFWAAFLALLMLTGCRAPGEKPDPKVAQALTARPFTAQAEVKWLERSFDASIERTIDGAMTITLTSEDLQIPVTLRREAGGQELTQGELNFKSPLQNTPGTGLLQVLEASLASLSALPASRQDGKVLLSGGGERILLDEATLHFLELDAEWGEVRFTSFAFLDSV